MQSWAQHFEDVLLARLFAGQASGFYIDVGASHPFVGSVTKYFYDLGWHGINVEPLPGRWAELQRDRPRDLNLRVALDRAPGRRSFLEAVDHDGLSTYDPAQGDHLKRLGLPLRDLEVETLTLDQVFARHAAGRTVDFLKIDVEGSEAAVLAGFDPRRYRPRVLVIESAIPHRPLVSWDAELVRRQEWEGPLLVAGYAFAHFDGVNSWYLRAEDRHLAGRLRLPPGVYDAIEEPYRKALEIEVAALREQRLRLEEEARRQAAELAALRRRLRAAETAAATSPLRRLRAALRRGRPPARQRGES